MEDVQRHILKSGNAFCMMDPSGDMPHGAGFGVYLEDTRHLARYVLSLEGAHLRLARSEAPTTYSARIDLLESRKEREDPPSHLQRETILDSAFREHLQLGNLTGEKRSYRLTLGYGVDFRDLFEVRGVVPRRKRVTRVELTRDSIQWRRRGRDAVHRWTRLRFSPPPTELVRKSASWELIVPPKASAEVDIKLDFGVGELPPASTMGSRNAQRRLAERRYAGEMKEWPGFEVDNEDVAAWMGRSLQDAIALLIDVHGHQVPAAGLPWYGTLFGRDSLIYGLETVAFHPSLSMETLRVLAKLQGREENPRRAEEPGKIPHELQRGELAGSGQIPFDPYYGTIDATPLFLCLLEEVYLWTNDREFCRELYPSAVAAAEFIQRRMDRDPYGFLSYVGDEPPRLRHHGWKDSENAVLHTDGREPAPPISLSEVQGYAYRGLSGLSSIAEVLGRGNDAVRLAQWADRIRAQFHDAFWMSSKGGYAMAVDGEGEQVELVTSNPGHLLACGILPRRRAAQVVRRLMEDDFLTGWGVRTMALGEPFYHPLSYHNGSVWPHDTAIVAWGMAKSGFREEASELFNALLEAAKSFGFRLPELYGGFARDETGGPIPIPQACDFQAWVAGAPFLLVRALLGIEARASEGRLYLRPYLPTPIGHLRIESLPVGDSLADLWIEGEKGEAEARVEWTRGPSLEVHKR